MNNAAAIRPFPTVIYYEKSHPDDKPCDLVQDDYFCEACDDFYMFRAPCPCGIPSHLVQALLDSDARMAALCS